MTEHQIREIVREEVQKALKEKEAASKAAIKKNLVFDSRELKNSRQSTR